MLWLAVILGISRSLFVLCYSLYKTPSDLCHCLLSISIVTMMAISIPRKFHCGPQVCILILHKFSEVIKHFFLPNSFTHQHIQLTILDKSGGKCRVVVVLRSSRYQNHLRSSCRRVSRPQTQDIDFQGDDPTWQIVY